MTERKDGVMILLEETKRMLGEHGLTPADVLFVRCGDRQGSWDDFAAVSAFDYYDGYGGAEISGELVIVGKDWWLERAEYDGAEWWELKRQPTPVDGLILPLTKKSIRL